MRLLSLCLLLLAATASAQSKPRRILYIGDSHSAGTFGRAMDDALRALPNTEVAFFAVCSSSPKSWVNETEHGCGFLFRGTDKKAPPQWQRTRSGTVTVNGQEREVTYVKTPLFSQLLTDYKPDLAIIALGSNPTAADGVGKLLGLVHQAGGACAWIGPPYMRNPPPAAVDRTYDKALSAEGVKKDLDLPGTRKEGCALIDSRDFDYLRYPAQGGDGTHYEATWELRDMAQNWAKDAAKAVAGLLNP